MEIKKTCVSFKKLLGFDYCMGCWEILVKKNLEEKLIKLNNNYEKK